MKKKNEKVGTSSCFWRIKVNHFIFMFATYRKVGLFIALAVAGIALSIYSMGDSSTTRVDPHILAYEVDLQQQHLKFYWKNESGENYANFQQLKSSIEAKGGELLFAMNGGMFHQDLSPQGLFIENKTLKKPLDTLMSGYGNFYLQPNGVFYITDEKKAYIQSSSEFTLNPGITYATQSGPMLLIKGNMHPAFNKGSANVHIRNGVGVLPNGKLLFAMSKKKINFYDFASFFMDNGCKNALYLDGFVSRTYLPKQNWNQLSGNFGVIIAETKK